MTTHFHLYVRSGRSFASTATQSFFLLFHWAISVEHQSEANSFCKQAIHQTFENLAHSSKSEAK